MRPSRDAPPVLYIVGAARSGSTLLDVVMGNAADWSSCGELDRFPASDGIPPGATRKSEKSHFWGRVRSQFRDDEILEMATLERRWGHHTAALRSFRELSRGKGDASRYRDYITKLYSVLGDYLQTGVIDSSKHPARAMHVYRALESAPHPPKFVYLRRSPVGVVGSFAKEDIEQPSRGLLNANAYYVAVNWLSQQAVAWLRDEGAKVATVTYEGLAREPLRTLAGLETTLDIDLSAPRHRLTEEAPLEVGPLFLGNRLRLADQIRIREPSEPQLGPVATKLTAALCGWMYEERG